MHGETPLPVTGSNPAGGDGATYTFQWQKRTFNGNWVNEGVSTTDNTILQPQNIHITTYFRRIITSQTICSSTSDSVTLTVFSDIGGNRFTPADETICEGNSPQPIEPSGAQDGFGTSSYVYQWQQKETGLWTNAESGTSSTISPDALFATTQYRRIVYSGEGPLGCMDTSDVFTVHVLPPIAGNYIQGNDQQFTCFNTPKQLGGSLPDGGDNTYSYSWLMSSNGLVWTNNSEDNTGKDFQTPKLIDSAFFKRIAYSSVSGRECVDTSDQVKILINELPTGSFLLSTDTVCENKPIDVGFNISGGHGAWM
ncbi:MAG: hypothetical protein HC906_02415 [Bacteroidales bacterium]|nr:hypothetical protein [Bacteroidales bacterium]